MTSNNSNSPTFCGTEATAKIRHKGRLCKILNLASGALLDLTTSETKNHIIGSLTSKAAIKHWRIISLGPGYALCPAEDTAIPRYIAPTWEGTGDDKPLGLSTFPTFWEFMKTSEYDTGNLDGGLLIDPDFVEEWTCAIKLPYHHDPRVLDLESNGRGTKVRFQPFREPRHERCQHWRIQFLDETPANAPSRSLDMPHSKVAKKESLDSNEEKNTLVITTITTSSFILPSNGARLVESDISTISTTSTAFSGSEDRYANL